MGSKCVPEVRIASHADCWLCVTNGVTFSPTPLHVVITTLSDILGQTT